MDNHGYPYHNAYGYPPPNSSPYPPPNPSQSPPPSYAPYPPPPGYGGYPPPPASAPYPSYHPPPYTSPHTGHASYPYQLPPPSQVPRPSHSGHVEYGYPQPPLPHSGHVPYPYYHVPPVTQSPPHPMLQQQHSFHGTSPYSYDHAPALPPAESRPNGPSRLDSFSSHHHNHSSSASFSLPANENVNDNISNAGTYPHSYPRIDGPSRLDSFSSHHHHGNSTSFSLPPNESVSDNLNNTGTYPHSYPHVDGQVNNNAPNYPVVQSPIEDHLANVHLSDNYASTTASAHVSSALTLAQPRPYYQSFSGRYDSDGSLYGHSNYGGSYAGSHSGSIEPSPRPALSHSSSFADSPNSQGFQLVPFGAPQKALQVLLLHGNLDIWVHEARNLPNMDMFHKTMGEMFNRLPGNTTKVTSDPYVSITIAGAVIVRTYVISNNENPVWMQHFNVPVAHRASEVYFLVKDSDVVGSQLIGTVSIPTESISSGARLEGSFPLINSNGRPCKNGATLIISIQYTPMERLSIYSEGVGADPQYYGIPATYFPLRRGGKVTLYQDAHVPDGYLPDLRLDGDMQYVHGKCWRDMFDAICRAQRMIYITGWSVWHKVKLVRDTGAPSECTLGELLKSKSQEGVRVLLLVWDDPTSRSIMGYKTNGVMATHDEETRRFFKHSSVQVLLCPRMAGKRLSWYKKTEMGMIFTHHQKTVIVDADAGAGNNKRRIVAFLGGLDVCNGRYDTPQHQLFRTLKTVHADDYHNPTLTGNLSGCPREPWHDLHCRIDGPAAYDVLANFEERWLKASKPHGIKRIKNSYDDALLRIERMPEMFYGMANDPCQFDEDPEGWHVQIFRSIDSDSVKGFPKDPKEATSKNLVCGKNVLIDMSIHSAYVKAIRSAQHFIYIENQYFVGSSYNWSSYKDVGANNLIPMEIALKIAQKIRAHERFAVYIVIPMWPEGNPQDAMIQRILFWQHKTMQMMYETIAKALMEVGLEDAHSPQDFLNFFCLGNREPIGPSDSSNSESPSPSNTPQALCRKNRRFMIYVHSKGMIVDDEYIIIGSANINQRSMEGTRDTEIAMGAYQPNHTWARKLSNPRAQIYGYRMSLWAEHLGVVEEQFMEPETLECVRKVKSMAEANWKQFASDEITEMKSHLIKYPVEVSRNGKVKPIPGFEKFPDVGGNIVGSFIGPQENLTI